MSTPALHVAYARLGRPEEAITTLELALNSCREAHYRAGEAAALDSLGLALCLTERYDDATEHHRQALALARDIGDPGLEADILNSSGETFNAAGQPDDAQACHDSALALARTHGIRHEEARALDGLAQILHNTGHPADARARWHEALAIYTELSVPKAATVRTQLAVLEGQD